MLNVMIDGIQVQEKEGNTLLEAARSAGMDSAAVRCLKELTFDAEDPMIFTTGHSYVEINPADDAVSIHRRNIMENKIVSRKLLKRLPLYLSYLKSLPEDSLNISATAMAKALELGHVQVRKDLAKVSETGRCRTGRNRHQLIQDIEAYLDFAEQTGTIVVGSGKLGQVLLDYSGFEKAGFNVMAGFDIAPCGDKTEGGKPIYPMNRLEQFCRYYDVHVGIIAVPEESAQEVCDILIACGIHAIWNFAPVHLQVPKHVLVQNENLAGSLTALRARMKCLMAEDKTEIQEKAI